MSQALESKVGHFVDPSGELFLEREDVDAVGTPLIGEDEHGLWWGTEHAYWVLSVYWAAVRVTGHLGSMPWEGWFVGTDDEAIDYAKKHRVVVEHVESGTTGLSYDLW